MIDLSEVRDLLACEIYAGEDHINQVRIAFGCASDLMSDVLAFSRAGAVLLTGLVTRQTIHTAYVAEIAAVVVVRGKRPAEDVIATANVRRIPLLGTQYSMYEACGKLYGKGLPSSMECAATGAGHGPE
jgi:predicted transcriptional regulator